MKKITLNTTKSNLTQLSHALLLSRKDAKEQSFNAVGAASLLGIGKFAMITACFASTGVRRESFLKF